MSFSLLTCAAHVNVGRHTGGPHLLCHRFIESDGIIGIEWVKAYKLNPAARSESNQIQGESLWVHRRSPQLTPLLESL